MIKNVMDIDWDDWDIAEDFPDDYDIVVSLVPYVGFTFNNIYNNIHRDLFDFNSYTLTFENHKSNTIYGYAFRYVIKHSNLDIHDIIIKTKFKIKNNLIQLSYKKLNISNIYHSGLDLLDYETDNIFISYKIIHLEEKMSFIIQKEHILKYYINYIKRIFRTPYDDHIDDCYSYTRVNIFNRLFKLNKLRKKQYNTYIKKTKRIQIDRKILNIISSKLGKEEYVNLLNK